MQRMIELDDEQLRALERLATAEGQSVDDLIRQAVDGYLARRGEDWSDWADRFDRVIARIQERIPPGVPEGEIEADVTAARAEVRAVQAARRATGGPPDARRR